MRSTTTRHESAVARLGRQALAGLAAVIFAAASAHAASIQTKTGRVSVETVTDGLSHPWAGVMLPDGSILVTERPGRLRRVTADGDVSDPLGGVPKVFAKGQGGLLDIVLAPDFADSRMVYLTFAEARDGGAATSVGRARLSDDATALEHFEVIFREKPAVGGGNHFGGRLAFAPDGKLFVTLGERFHHDQAQDPTNTLGTVVRINPDGSVPDDNPFADGGKGAPEVWSFGHRNVEGAAIEPATGRLWTDEMGPRGGDELNTPEPGRNYGWNVVSWGIHYNGKPIPDPDTHPEFADAHLQWTPVISPSGMTFYDGDLFSKWKGDLLIAGLSAHAIVRVAIDGDKATEEDRIDLGARVARRLRRQRGRGVRADRREQRQAAEAGAGQGVGVFLGAPARASQSSGFPHSQPAQMRVLVVQNYEGTGLGQIGRALDERNAEIQIVKAHEGAPLPDTIEGHDGLVVLGGGQNALADDESPWLPHLVGLMRETADSGRAVLGVCLGAQLLARACGAENLIGAAPEFAWRQVRLTGEGQGDPLFAAVPQQFPIFEWHDDTFTLPAGAVRLAENDAAPNQAFRVGRAGYGIQFHFEADRALVAEWNETFAGYIGERHPDWPARHAAEAARHGEAADAAGLAIARAWAALV